MPSEFVVAIKRMSRGVAPADWQEQVQTISGIEQATSSSSPERMRIHATSTGLHKLREAFGEILHIEPLIAHSKLDKV